MTLNQAKQKYVGKKFKYISPYSGKSKWTSRIKAVNGRKIRVFSKEHHDEIFTLVSIKGIIFYSDEIELQ